MKIPNAYKYGPRASAEQRVLLGKIAGPNRKVWNMGLALNNDCYANGKSGSGGVIA